MRVLHRGNIPENSALQLLVVRFPIRSGTLSPDAARHYRASIQPTYQENLMDDQRKGTPIDESETDFCRALWMAVLIQACIDARSGSTQRDTKRDKAEALAWLSDAEEGGDFVTVCELAGLDPSKARKSIKRFLGQKNARIDFRCLRKGRSRKPSADNDNQSAKGGKNGERE